MNKLSIIIPCHFPKVVLSCYNACQVLQGPDSSLAVAVAMAPFDSCPIGVSADLCPAGAP